MQLEVVDHSKIDSFVWDSFIERSPQCSLYALHGFATAIRSDWQAMIVKDDSGWLAVMPFCVNRKWRYTYVPQPPFAQFWGVYFAPFSALSTYRKLSLKGQILKLIVDYLNQFHLVIQNFSPEFEYPLPFYWGGYNLHTRYTFRVRLEQAEKDLFAQLEPSLRRQVRKADRREIHLRTSQSASALLQLLSINSQQGKDLTANNPDAREILQKICDYLFRSGNGEIIEAYTPDNQLCAAALLGFFQGKSYYLMGAFDPAHQASGAMTRTLWEGIRRAKMSGSSLFDFEGSMIPGIEHFFRKFGAHPVPYLQIHKNQLPLIAKWIHALKT